MTIITGIILYLFVYMFVCLFINAIAAVSFDHTIAGEDCMNMNCLGAGEGYYNLSQEYWLLCPST